MPQKLQSWWLAVIAAYLYGQQAGPCGLLVVLGLCIVWLSLRAVKLLAE
jgi:hypothetical protein